MNLIDLKSFLAVVEYRSVSLAAKRLFVTPSAVTKRIQRLESELGMRLFIVDGVRLKLTEAGKIVIPYVRQMLAMHDEMRRSISSQQPGTSLKIGTSVYVSHYLIYDFVNYVKAKDERITINVKTINEKDYLEQLDNGFVDLVLCTPRPTQSKTLACGQLWREKLSITTSEKHPLADKNNVTLAELSTYEAIFPEKGGYIREKVESLFMQHHLPLNIVLEAGIIYAVKNLLDSGNYWSIIHKRVWDESNLREIKIPGIDLDIKFNWYCMNRRVQEKLMEEVIGYLKTWAIDSELIQLYSLP